jgi:Ca2+-binding RTX toxin-like protein
MATFSTSFATDLTNLSQLNVLAGYPVISLKSPTGFRATKGSLTGLVSGENFIWEPFSDVPTMGKMQALSISALLTNVSFTGLSLDYLSFRSTLQSNGADAALAMLLGGSDTINGSAYADHLLGFNGTDTIHGKSGNDTLEGGAGSDYLHGEDNNDKLYGSVGSDSLHGGDGYDELYGGADNDILDGGAGKDLIGGSTGFDVARYETRTEAVEVTLDGGTLVKVKVGGVVEDKIANIEGVVGGKGNDKLTGDGLVNSLMGGDGNDTLKGGGSTDYLAGGADNDEIRGGAGNDTLSGGAGKDTVFGGAGADRFQFDSTPIAGNEDQVQDFAVGVDKVALSKYAFTSLGGIYLPSSALDADYFALGSAKDANDYIIYDKGKLYYDADGNLSNQGKVLVAIFKDAPKLTHADFDVY